MQNLQDLFTIIFYSNAFTIVQQFARFSEQEKEIIESLKKMA